MWRFYLWKVFEFSSLFGEAEGQVAMHHPATIFHQKSVENIWFERIILCTVCGLFIVRRQRNRMLVHCCATLLLLQCEQVDSDNSVRFAEMCFFSYLAESVLNLAVLLNWLLQNGYATTRLILKIYLGGGIFGANALFC